MKILIFGPKIPYLPHFRHNFSQKMGFLTFINLLIKNFLHKISKHNELILTKLYYRRTKSQPKRQRREEQNY